MSSDTAQGSSSPATVTVQGFTPINHCFDCKTSSETSISAAQVQDGVKNGKKRQRKTAPATQNSVRSAHVRPPKKSKRKSTPRDQDISDVFIVTKPYAQGVSNKCMPEKYPIPAAVEGTEAQPFNSLETGLPEPLKEPSSPATFQAVEQPIINGLGSIYQAAFKPEEKRFVPEEPSDLDLSKILPSDTDGKTGHFTCDSIPSSADVNSVQDTVGQAIPSSWISPSELDDILTQNVIGSVCQVPCSSPVHLGDERTEAMDAEPAATTTLLLPPGQCSPNCHLNDWKIADSGGPNPYENLEARCNDLSSPRLNSCNADVQDFDDFVLAASKEKYFPTQMELDDHNLSILTSDFINSQAEVKGNSPESLNPSPKFSFSSDVDIWKAFDENDVDTISSNVSFVVSSSPYLQSRSNPQEDIELYDPSAEAIPSNQVYISEGIFDDDDDIEAVLAECLTPPSAQVPRPSPPSSDKAPFSPITSSPLKTEPAKSESKKGTSQSMKMPHKISFYPTGTPIPFIRPPFPPPVRDRSPVVGFGNGTFLRTCFRIGEALNAGSLAIRTKQDAVIELYVRVVFSERPPKSVKQHFFFADIFSPEKPPFLKGTYGLWKGSELWDLDSRIFLGEKGKGKMARVVGRMSREEKNRGLEMTVLSIWEANWEDVEMVKGVVCR